MVRTYVCTVRVCVCVCGVCVCVCVSACMRVHVLCCKTMLIGAFPAVTLVIGALTLLSGSALSSVRVNNHCHLSPQSSAYLNVIVGGISSFQCLPQVANSVSCSGSMGWGLSLG